MKVGLAGVAAELCDYRLFLLADFELDGLIPLRNNFDDARTNQVHLFIY